MARIPHNLRLKFAELGPEKAFVVVDGIKERRLLLWKLGNRPRIVLLGGTRWGFVGDSVAQ
jgi:hypothetical protein